MHVCLSCVLHQNATCGRWYTLCVCTDLSHGHLRRKQLRFGNCVLQTPSDRSSVQPPCCPVPHPSGSASCHSVHKLAVLSLLKRLDLNTASCAVGSLVIEEDHKCCRPEDATSLAESSASISADSVFTWKVETAYMGDHELKPGICTAQSMVQPGLGTYLCAHEDVID